MKKHSQDNFEPIFKTILLIGSVAAIVFFVSQSNNAPATNDNNLVSTSPVSVLGENQIIEVLARGGYSPRQITAKAGISSILRMSTQNTFDCSSALTVPALNYRAYLPPTGITEIPIPPQKPGTVITGLCSMGMYSFKIRFE
jgi:plastocyanin domain-containing protein